MTAVSSFALGAITFEVVVCADPSTGDECVYVYRTDIHPRELIATGEPEALMLRPAYKAWAEKLPVLEQAVVDSLEGAAA